jgi:formate dehydrogenase subunit gamma
MGGEKLVDYLSAKLRAVPGQTAPDGSVSFKSVYCLGNCALSPALMLDGALYGRVSPERADTILAGALS